MQLEEIIDTSETYSSLTFSGRKMINPKKSEEKKAKTQIAIKFIATHADWKWKLTTAQGFCCIL